MDLLRGEYFLDQRGDFTEAKKIIDKNSVIIFYFSAGWCSSPLQEKVLNLLKVVHLENRKRHSGFEIVFVSFDHDSNGFRTTFNSHGDWYAIPNHDMLRELLRQVYSVTTIPTLIVVRQNGDIISREGQNELMKKGINVLVTWAD